MSSFEDKLKKLCEDEGKEDVLKKLTEESIPIPAEVKKLVVEHVIQDKGSSTYRRKLRLFSGSKPAPHGEVNFQTWRASAKQVVDDDGISEKEKRRCIMDSLLIPALNVVKNLPGTTTSEQLFKKLQKVYGTTESSEDMLYNFFEIFQKDKQLSSDFLQDLYTALTDILDASLETTDANTINEHLQNQFIRGCFDEELIAKLRLEEKKDDVRTPAPSFEELYESIKKEELKRDQKIKRKEAVSKKRIQQHNITKPELDGGSGDTTSVTEMYQLRSNFDRKNEELTKRMALLEASQKAICDQLKQLSQQLSSAFGTPTEPSPSQQSTNHAASSHEYRPQMYAGLSGQQASPHAGTSGQQYGQQSYNHNANRPANTVPTRFCYNCGIENHHMQRCRNDPNPTLVGEKIKQRSIEAAKQREASTAEQPLNI